MTFDPVILRPLDPARDPRINEREESELRQALEAVPRLAQAAARAKVVELEARHGERRGWVWARLGWSAWAKALEPLARLAQDYPLMIVTKGDLLDQETKLAQAQRLVSSTPSLMQDLELATQRLKAAESEMASGDMYSWIIDTMGKFREGYAVDIPQFSREVPCAVGLFPTFPYKAVLFNVRGTAYFHDLGRFLADFENRFPTLRVQNLEMEPVGASAANSATDPEKLTFRMEVVVLVNPNAL